MVVSESAFKFSNPALYDVNFVVNEEFIEKNFEGFENTNIKRDITRDSDIHATVSLSLECGDLETAPFYFKMKMQAEFKWDESLNEKDEYGRQNVEGFLDYTAPSLLLSYMRPIMASITNASRYPVYNIPFLDFRTLENSSEVVESNIEEGDQ